MTLDYTAVLILQHVIVWNAYKDMAFPDCVCVCVLVTSHLGFHLQGNK